MKYEANREGQDVYGEFEEVDGMEGLVGRVEALQNELYDS
jgi:hypothetical protein